MNLKLQAAQQALDLLQNGMVVGLGSGSTASLFVSMLGESLRTGRLFDIIGIATSQTTADLAHSLDIPLTSLAEHSTIDLAVDGADEVDPNLDLIKGLGKALLREKMVEVHARRFVVIVDESKLVPKLGTRDALPVEIVQFEWQASLRWLNTLGCRAELWRNELSEPYVTDNGNYLARCWFEGPGSERVLSGILDPALLARQLADFPGIVEHGLFLGMANQVIVAGTNGIRILERTE
jgi:ribose 5-phosphate isomerase A